jgi:uncharacterized membrane protein YhaH (DUF805 family)
MKMPRAHLRLHPRPVPGTCRLTAYSLALLALVLTIAFSLSPTSISASSGAPPGGLALQVNAGFSSYFRNGTWIPLYITLRNNGPDFSGTLSTSNPEGPIWQPTFTTVPVSIYQEPVAVRHGIQKQVTIYLPVSPIFSVASIRVQLLDSHGNVVQSQIASLRQLDPGDVFVGLLSGQTTGFDPLQTLALPNQNASVKIQFLNAQTMPGRAAVLANFNLIVLDAFMTSSLTHEQLRALQIWVLQGGTLIEIGGPQWRQTLGPLPADLLPIKVYDTGVLPAGTHLLPGGGPTAGSSGVPISRDTIHAPITVSTATVLTGARTILSSGTMPLLVQAEFGQGLIYYLAYDPTLEPVVDWPGATALWKGLIIRSLGEQLLPSSFSAGLSNGIPYYLAQLQHLLLPTPSPVPWILLLFFLCYLVVLGPVRWLIVRRTKQRKWSWRIALSTILIFSLLNFAAALYQQGTSMLGNSLSIIHLTHGGSFVHSTTYLGVYVPFVSSDGDVQVQLPDGMLVQPFADTTQQQEQTTITATSDGVQVKVSGAAIRVLNALQTEQDLSMQGGIVSHLVLGQGTLTGTVTNRLLIALNDAYVLMPHSIAPIGNLGPGQTSSARLSLPLPSTKGGLPACGSLVKQMVANDTGILTEYDHLFTHSFPQSLSERQRHLSLLAFLLTALQCSNPPLEATGSSAILIGWADQPVDGVNAVTFNGIHPGGLHETVLLAPVDITYAAGPLTLPPDVLPGRLVDAEAQNVRLLSPNSYALTSGQVTFEYSVPTSEHLHVQTITVSQPADSSIPPDMIPGSSLSSTSHISLYNWQTSSWNAISLTQSASFTTQNAKAYLSPDGRVLVQYVNQASGLASIAFTKPSLTITGIASNS